jgi:hypothetical protein
VRANTGPCEPSCRVPVSPGDGWGLWVDLTVSAPVVLATPPLQPFQPTQETHQADH